MRKWSRYLIGVVAVTGLYVLTANAMAETCTLELKKVDLSVRSDSVDLAFRYSFPQTFVHYTDGSARIVTPPPGASAGLSADQDKPEFSEVIKRDRADYHSESPFRGVAELGSQYYGFVLDTAPVEESSDEDTAVPSTPARPTNEPATYRRLHFDLNHNGDLTDDVVIEAASARTTSAVFPTIDIQLDIDGKKVDYAFRFSVVSRRSSSVSYSTASLSSAAYREGEILLDGQKRRVVLVDVNSNGRFDDAPVINPRYQSSSGAIYSLLGDMLYIDPQATRRSYYDARSSEDQFYVGGLISYGGRFMEVEVHPGGETLTINPSSEPVGFVTNPNQGFRAFLYGDRGMLEIVADSESERIAIPEGDWRLLSYTIELKGFGDEPTVLDVLYSALPVPPNRNVVSARGTRDCEAVKVVAGQTVEMPFGPPYRLDVSSRPIATRNSLSLSMTLIGTAGEICSGLTVNGGRPSQPEFTITSTDGQEVAAGKFKYG